MKIKNSDKMINSKDRNENNIVITIVSNSSILSLTTIKEVASNMKESLCVPKDF